MPKQIKGTNTDVLLEANFPQKVIDKLVNYRNTNADYFTSAIDYLARQHYRNCKPLREFTRETSIHYLALAKLFKTYGLPIRPPAEAVRENWKDEDFRKRNAESVREASKSYIEFAPEYQEDLQRYTASVVEANTERAILNAEREYEIKYWNKNLNARIHKSREPVYFLTTTQRGNKVAYVLIDKPNKKTMQRKKELESQGIRVRFATEKFYKTLEKLMAKRVENWETPKK